MKFLTTWFVAASTALTLLLTAPSVGYADDSAIQPDNLFPRVRFVVTVPREEGPEDVAMIVELDRLRAPYTVDNFLRYVVDGRYDNTIFHRVISDFVVQGGGFDAEFNEIERNDPVFNEREPHSARSQFYFNTADNNSLNPSTRRWGYAVFGRVVDNAEVLKELMEVETHTHEDTGYEDVPVSPLMLKEATLLPREPRN